MNCEIVQMKKVWKAKLEKGLVKDDKLKHVLESTHQNILVKFDEKMSEGNVIATKSFEEDLKSNPDGSQIYFCLLNCMRRPFKKGQ